MYQYPDKNDAYLNEYVIDERWRDGGLEEKYFADCFNIIADKGNLLDIGCGYGRHLNILMPFFKKITAIDPDIDRLNEAKKEKARIENLDAKTNCQIKFENISFHDFLTDSLFDCILCSHVFNHMSTDAARFALKKIHSLLKKNGCFILLVTNWKSEQDLLTKIDLLKKVEYIITEEEFNLCAEQNNNFLPVRYFSENTIRQLLKEAKFEIVFLKKYHNYPIIERDNFVFAKAIK